MNKQYANYPSLKGLRVFVTGGATGIGAAIVRAFAGQGATIGFVDIADTAGQALATELSSQSKTWFKAVDVTDVPALQQAIHDFDEQFGTVDILVNNVANDARHDWRDVSPESWQRSLSVNLNPAFFAIQAVAEGMISQKSGSIINFSSISWKVKQDNMPAYTTAKSAIHGLTRSFVKPLGSAGVRINTVTPGWVMTEKQVTEHYDEAGVTFLKNNQPLAGTIMPEDAAAMVLFLAAYDSAMCTGQEFTIDGGWT
jgi:NAD(P)-dependent dehydrogenase (short-subunit alcohol dehydrogenase family)